MEITCVVVFDLLLLFFSSILFVYLSVCMCACVCVRDI